MSESESESEIEARLSSALSAVRAYLEAKLVTDAVSAAEKGVAIAHELGREHPKYVEALRIAALAYALDQNTGMSTRYMRQAVSAAEKQTAYPKERLGSLRFELCRAELDRGNRDAAADELDKAIPELQTDRDKRDAEARQAMFLRVALCMISGDPKDEVDTFLERLRAWLTPIFTSETRTANDKALAEHDMVTALSSAARLKIAQRRYEQAEAVLLEGFERAERHIRDADRPNPHLLGLVTEVYKELRQHTKAEPEAVRSRPDKHLRPAAIRAEKLFWSELRVALEDARKQFGWSEVEAARKIEPALRDGDLTSDLAKHTRLFGMIEVLGRQATKGTNLRDRGSDELRRVMRGEKPLAEALDALEAVGLMDV